jgi:malate dehydrogenase (oxaloacetate-decarboxylating)
MHPETMDAQCEDGLDTPLSGIDLINDPMLNKGTAFNEQERTEFSLHGLLPPHVGTLDDQTSRRLKALAGFTAPFQKYAFLRDLQDTNETLFYSVLTHNFEELLPLVYTPTVGEGCQRFSEIWRKPRGLFLSYPNQSRIPSILAHPRYDRVRVIVVSDGERVLGLGDQGAGGMGIPIGKLALYTACAGIHPRRTLPMLLDLGTDNVERRTDPLYIGWRHERIRGDAYDEFVDAFVTAVNERWPDVLLQWEDFSGANASRLLDRYRDRLCTFNDDIQGTAAVAAGTLLAAAHATGLPLSEQRIAVLGAGSAGCGISALLMRAMEHLGLRASEARRRFYLVDRCGLLLEGMTGLRPAQESFTQPRDAVAGWVVESPDRIGLLDVIQNARPTALLGVSGQAGAFTEEIVRAMARQTPRPIICPLSNPTSRAEATPADILRWTEGRSIVGTGSPFASFEFEGRVVPVDQINNSYIFPGLGLGVLSANARRVTDGMFMSAAVALAALTPAREGSTRLLPPMNTIRSVSYEVAKAVSRQAQEDGVAPPCDDEKLERRIRSNMWEPVYCRYRRRI